MREKITLEDLAIKKPMKIDSKKALQQLEAALSLYNAFKGYKPIKT